MNEEIELILYAPNEKFPSMVLQLMETTIINARVNEDCTSEIAVNFRNDFIIVANYENSYAGFLSFGKLSDNEFSIKAIFVDRLFRRRHLGQSMLQFAITEIKKFGGVKIRMTMPPEDIIIRCLVHSIDPNIETIEYKIKV